MENKERGQRGREGGERPRECGGATEVWVHEMMEGKGKERKGREDMKRWDGDD